MFSLEIRLRDRYGATTRDVCRENEIIPPELISRSSGISVGKIRRQEIIIEGKDPDTLDPIVQLDGAMIRATRFPELARRLEETGDLTLKSHETRPRTERDIWVAGKATFILTKSRIESHLDL